MTAKLTGGKDFFCSKGIMAKGNDDEIKAEEDKMQAILLLKMQMRNVMAVYRRV